MNIKLYSALTRQFLRFLEDLDPKDIQALEERTKKIELSLSSPRAAPKQSMAAEDYARLAERLKTAATHNEGADILKDLTKEELSQLSRILDLPLQKSDPIDRVRDRILHSTIGFKLRSQAIQQEQPKP